MRENIWGLIGIIGALLFGITSWWLFNEKYTDYAVIAAVLALLYPTIGVGFQALQENLGSLDKKISTLTPDFVEAYINAMSPAITIDHSMPLVADTLYSALTPAFTALSDSKALDDEVFFKQLMTEVVELKEGNRILAICGRKFWTEQSHSLVEDYWKLNKQKATEKVLIQRVFVADSTESDDPEFSLEVETALQRNIEFCRSLKTWAAPNGGVEDLSGRLRVRQVSADARDALHKESWLNPKFGFALISKRSHKVVALHRLVDGHLRGLFINIALVYSVFEQHFWSVWKVGDDV